MNINKKLFFVFLLLAPFFTSCSSSRTGDDLVFYHPGNNENEYYVSARDRKVSGTIVIPNEYLGLPVTGISNFRNTAIDDIVIGDNVKVIADLSFENCKNLTRIIVPDNVVEIGQSAFCNCTNLETIFLGTNVTELKPAVFANCPKIASFLIPSSILNISQTAFYGCDSLISFGLENNEYFEIDNGVILNKQKNQIVIFPSGFSGEYVIPDSILSLREKLFFKCNLKKIIINKNIYITIK